MYPAQGVGKVAKRKQNAPRKSGKLKHSRFFFYYAVASLAVVIAGFASRAIVLPDLLPPITPTIVFHIILMLAWYSLVIVQAQWIAKKNAAFHKQVGKLSPLLVAAILITGTLVTLETYARRIAADAYAPEFAVYLSFSSLLGFVILYALAYINRASGDDHKRYIVMAGTAMILAATFRLAAAFGAPQPIPMGIVIQFGFLTALMFYDLKKFERMHVATMLGMLVHLIITAGIFTLGASSMWAGFIKEVLTP